MKKIYLLFLGYLFLNTQVLFAQVPQKMSFQAVVRNASNSLITSSPVGMKISILQGSANGTAVYVETQNTTTNTNGLVNLIIGNGTVVSGTFASINWASGNYFLKSEIDPTGGTNYTIANTTQLLSVPYALQAQTASNYLETDPQVSVSNTNTCAKWNGATLVDGQIFDDGTYIGIGTTAPSQKLHVKAGNILADRGDATGGVSRKLILEGARASTGAPFAQVDFNNFDSTNSINYTGASIQSQNIDGTEDGDLSFFTNDGTLTEKMNISNQGNVTILKGLNIDKEDESTGTLTDTALTFGLNKTCGITSGRKEGDFWEHNTLNFYTNNSKRMVINKFGNVGIGTPTGYVNAKLQIEGSDSNYIPNYGYLNGDGDTGMVTNGVATHFSLIASHKIAATSFNAFSDKRIKNIIGVSNSKNDLIALSKIKITDYKLIDTIAKGNLKYKKVIAQELKEVYPLAVSMHTEVIPNIYKHTKMQNGFVNLMSDVKIGDKIKVIFNSKSEILNVEYVDNNGFKLNSSKTGEVFVYGKLVNDFHTVDYEALSTLNISATQELIKRIEQLEKENMSLKAEVETTKEINNKLQVETAEINTIKNELQSIKAIINKLNTSSETTFANN